MADGMRRMDEMSLDGLFILGDVGGFVVVVVFLIDAG